MFFAKCLDVFWKTKSGFVNRYESIDYRRSKKGAKWIILCLIENRSSLVMESKTTYADVGFAANARSGKWQCWQEECCI